MELIAKVEASYGVHFVRIPPVSARFEVNVRPRPAHGQLITITFAGLSDVNVGSFDLWRDIHAPTGEIDRRWWRPTVLADLLTAANGDLFLRMDRTADELAAFANDRGGALLAAIRTELASTHEVGLVAQQARRFAAVLRVDWEPELDELHPIEQLMALEHAVVSWMREPPSEVALLAKELPLDTKSAGVSTIWLQWWWRFVRAVTARDLRAAVAAAVEIARTECGREFRSAVDEAARMAIVAEHAPRGVVFAAPVGGELVRDDDDAHYASFMAVTHAAHAIAAALLGELGSAEANAHAMELVARAAIRAI